MHTLPASRMRAMPAPPLRARCIAIEPPVVLVPGLYDSGPGHWQTLWHEANPGWLRVVQSDWAAPKLDRWAAAIARAIDAARAAPVIVAHGFGCLAALRATHLLERPVAAALLVAPIDPDHVDATSRLPSRRLPFPSVVVGSSNDPWLKITKAGALATRWGSGFVGLENAGHVNVASGHGTWPEGRALLATLVRDIERRIGDTLPA